MLSAYLRFKYPNVVKAALAASAPIYMLADTTSRSFFFKAVTDVSIITPISNIVIKAIVNTLDQDSKACWVIFK